MSEGKAYLIENTGEYLKFLLYDYDVGGCYLKPVHKSWLDLYVVAPRAYRSLEVQSTGYASKGASTEFTRQTACNRASVATDYVVNRGRIPPANTNVAEPNLQEDDDPLEQDGWRAVLVEVWYY